MLSLFEGNLRSIRLREGEREEDSSFEEEEGKLEVVFEVAALERCSPS